MLIACISKCLENRSECTSDVNKWFFAFIMFKPTFPDVRERYQMTCFWPRLSSRSFDKNRLMFSVRMFLSSVSSGPFLCRAKYSLIWMIRKVKKVRNCPTLWRWWPRVKNVCRSRLGPCRDSFITWLLYLASLLEIFRAEIGCQDWRSDKTCRG